jgi:hypothetical protein
MSEPVWALSVDFGDRQGLEGRDGSVSCFFRALPVVTSTRSNPFRPAEWVGDPDIENLGDQSTTNPVWPMPRTR